MALDLEKELDQDKFRENLAEAITWCSLYASLEDPRDSLRTFSKDLPYLSAPQHVLHYVCLGRSNRLFRDGQLDLKRLTNLSDGRLLAYWPEWSDSSGASQNESRGFFDVHDCPPFDTWVWYVSKDDQHGAENILHVNDFLVA